MKLKDLRKDDLFIFTEATHPYTPHRVSKVLKEPGSGKQEVFISFDYGESPVFWEDAERPVCKLTRDRWGGYIDEGGRPWPV